MCVICGKHFADKGNLQRHQLTHWQYKTADCKVTFTHCTIQHTRPRNTIYAVHDEHVLLPSAISINISWWFVIQTLLVQCWIIAGDCVYMANIYPHDIDCLYSWWLVIWWGYSLYSGIPYMGVFPGWGYSLYMGIPGWDVFPWWEYSLDGSIPWMGVCPVYGYYLDGSTLWRGYSLYHWVRNKFPKSYLINHNI